MASFTSLSLRALVRSAATRAGLDHDRGTLSGLSGSARALYVAAHASGAPERVVAVVVPTDTDVDTLLADTRFFLSVLEGLDDAALTAAVLPLPSHEVDPYRGLMPHLQVASARATTLSALAAGEARVVVASAAALLPKLVRPEQLAQATIDLRPGVDIEPQRLAEKLVAAGYSRQDPVDEHGEFCVRGGIVDVFPPGDEEPIRIEFIGDTVESLRRFDPSTQRSSRTIDQSHIVPIRERVGESETPADPSRPPRRQRLRLLCSPPSRDLHRRRWR